MSDIVKKMVSNALWGGSGSGLPTGSEPHQMLVTNAEGKAEWQERLAWTEAKYVTVLPETTLDFVESENSPGFGEHLLQKPVENFPVNGDECVVTWNGTDYKGIWRVGEFGNYVMAQLQMSDNSAPCQVMLAGNDAMVQMYGGYGFILQNGSIEPATVEIKNGGEVVQKIPEKYLPEQQSDLCILNVPKDEDNFSMPDKTYDELLEAYNAGKHIICVYDSDLSTDTAYIMPLTHFYNETFYFGALTTPAPREEATYGMIVATMTKDGGFVKGSYNNIVCYGTIETKNANGFILPSPNGTRYKVTVSDDGTLTATAL